MAAEAMGRTWEAKMSVLTGFAADLVDGPLQRALERSCHEAISVLSPAILL
jgi:hypothetical protein